MILTKSLEQFIENHRQNLAAEEFEKLKWDIDSALELYLQDLAQYSAGVERGSRVHFLIEIEIMKASNIQVSCHRGCAACCHFEVEITQDEAEILEQKVSRDGVGIDFRRLRELSQRSKQGPEWKLGPVANNRCLFLGSDNACRVYDARPASCRKLSVISPPSECSSPQGKPVPRVIPMVEVIMSAALNFEGNDFGSMTKLLMRRYLQILNPELQENP